MTKTEKLEIINKFFNQFFKWIEIEDIKGNGTPNNPFNISMVGKVYGDGYDDIVEVKKGRITNSFTTDRNMIRDGERTTEKYAKELIKNGVKNFTIHLYMD